MGELLAALEALDDMHLIFTMPNADTHGRVIVDMIKQFVVDNPKTRVYTSLGQLRYLSCLNYVDGVVGNSSSGLLEVPSFYKGTINIGDRQRGRLKEKSVIDCIPEKESIAAALRKLYSEEFQLAFGTVKNPYGEGGASKKIVEILQDHSLDFTLKKPFYNLV